FLPLCRPSMGHEEINQVVDCLKSGWITTGPLCKKFEEQFCELTGAPFAVTVSSGTAGMHIALIEKGIGPGDEIITPSMTFASTINLITMLGARPVFVDIDYGTLNVNADLIEEKIAGKTRATIPVHFAGAPADMDKIMSIAQRHGLSVIEDAAHAVGTYYKGVHAGGFGGTAIFSFHPIKNITTGEGGMITHFSAKTENRLRQLRFHGLEKDAWKRYGKGGNPEYDIYTPGFKYNLTDMQAALGLAQIARLTELNRRRAYLAALYMDGLRGAEGIHLPLVPDYPHDHAWHLFIIKLIHMDRRLFMEKLSDYNVGYGLHFPANHLLSYVKERFPTDGAMLPETERAARGIISLPLFPDMRDDDVSYVCDAIKEIMKT
ncbi:MAG: aminotransferase class I/II-fold pyridoxal phosphate-dependent enzyme, partial [Syntrophales bacterium LBB04]|nr:aminotransferase class I/II-fold pyridoxal phosphate-dependent enzyme [Syntrophales bacterium LBB04]